MEVRKAEQMARGLMARHGLAGWRLELTSSKRRGGSCWWQRRLIRLSRPIIELNNEAMVLDIVLHEIAHALVGPGFGHGRVWKAKAIEVGATPRASLPYRTPVGAWQAQCGCPGQVYTRHRRPRPGTYCPRCGRGLRWRNTTTRR